jgi:FKBP-type peptidyl-prolyl cis-trans isomerase (trigger factor)
MTIETATPNNLEILAGMFDTLVNAVAARVLEQLNDNFNARLERFAEEELDEKIDEWAANFLDDRVKEHVVSDDLHDEVLEIVQNLSFDIRVSR